MAQACFQPRILCFHQTTTTKTLIRKPFALRSQRLEQCKSNPKYAPVGQKKCPDTSVIHYPKSVFPLARFFPLRSPRSPPHSCCNKPLHVHTSNKPQYRVVPGHRNWQIETAAWIWPSFFHCALETRWLGVRKTCGIGLFYRNYRPLLQETGWLVSDFISVCFLVFA